MYYNYIYFCITQLRVVVRTFLRSGVHSSGCTDRIILYEHERAEYHFEPLKRARLHGTLTMQHYYSLKSRRRRRER